MTSRPAAGDLHAELAVAHTTHRPVARPGRAAGRGVPGRLLWLLLGLLRAVLLLIAAA
ncbi:MAG TPA: hypothetical protein VFN34_07915 [Ornithinibacter sp.]|nr:hypothetical protein [Ornithinibacter sp.]